MWLLEKSLLKRYISLWWNSLLYKCPEEHRFQAAGNERKKERILIERMKERKQEKEKERKRERKKNPGKLPGRSTTSI